MFKNRSTAVRADLGAFIRRKRINYSAAGVMNHYSLLFALSLSSNNHFDTYRVKPEVFANDRQQSRDRGVNSRESKR